jgi:hypothetical protein
MNMPSDGEYYFGSSHGKATPAWLSSVESPITSAITTGNSGRLADAAAEAKEALANLDAATRVKHADLVAKLKEVLTRVDKIEQIEKQKRFEPTPARIDSPADARARLAKRDAAFAKFQQAIADMNFRLDALERRDARAAPRLVEPPRWRDK